MINIFRKNKIRVSLFIEPKISDIKISKEVGADCIEIHTGKYCNAKSTYAKSLEYKKIRKAANFAKFIGLKVHAGHGLNYDTAKKISNIKTISELNIGHFIIAESIFIGLKNAINKFKKIIKR